jgi:hypothetical protein
MSKANPLEGMLDDVQVFRIFVGACLQFLETILVPKKSYELYEIKSSSNLSKKCCDTICFLTIKFLRSKSKRRNESFAK